MIIIQAFIVVAFVSVLHLITKIKMNIKFIYDELKQDNGKVFWYIFAAFICFMISIYHTSAETDVVKNTNVQRLVIKRYRTIFYGDDAKFKCSHQADDDRLDYLWEKDGIPLTYQASKIELDRNTGSLSILCAATYDSGIYECYYYGILESSTQVMIIDPPTIYSFKNSKVKLGEFSKISCIVKYDSDPVELKLLKNGREITKNSKKVSSKPYREIFYPIESVTKNDEATYTCIVRAEGHYDFQKSKLEIEDEPEKLYVVYHLNEGESFTMTCNTSANFSNVVWKKEIVTKNGMRYYLDVVDMTCGRQIVIKDVFKEQSGTYWCVYDDDSEIQVGAINRLEISPVPRIINTYGENYLILNKGQNHTIQLKIIAHEISMIEWYAKGKLISKKEYNKSTRQLKVLMKDGVLYTELELKNIKLSDNGKYMCIVSNEYGRDHTAVLVWTNEGWIFTIVCVSISIVVAVILCFLLYKVFKKLEENEKNKSRSRRNRNNRYRPDTTVG